MKNTLIISHKSDIDGMGSVILSKIAFNKVDYLLFLNPTDLGNSFDKMMNDKMFDKYDNIYICDLTLVKPYIDIVNNDIDLKSKIKIFDHHQKAIEQGLDKYEFCTIIEKDIKKRCGTDLFYEYLCNNNLINKNNILDSFVEKIRLEDNWEWKKYGNFGIKAHDLSYLYTIQGPDLFIDTFVNKLIKTDELNEEEQKLVDDYKKDINKTMEEYLSSALFMVDENGIEFVTLFCDYKYRNDITDYIESIYGYKYKYVVIVALDNGKYGQKSYRSIDPSIDVNEICIKYNGGGHPGAAAVLINKTQREEINNLKKEDALKYIVTCSYEE